MVISRVGPLSCAKVVGLLYVIIGLILGGIFSLIAASGAIPPGRNMPASLFGVAAIVFLPVAYGVMGFLMTLIVAWLYNALAGLVGGVEIELR